MMLYVVERVSDAWMGVWRSPYPSVLLLLHLMDVVFVLHHDHHDFHLLLSQV